MYSETFTTVPLEGSVGPPINIRSTDFGGQSKFLDPEIRDVV